MRNFSTDAILGSSCTTVTPTTKTTTNNNYNPINVVYLYRLTFYLLFIMVTDVTHAFPRKTPPAMEEGDLALGALMMVHSRENETLICGEVMPQGGVQAVEAMLFTLDWINANGIIPYTKLGARILDDCDKDTYGLQQAVDFIKGKIDTLQSGYTCTYANSSEKYSIQPITGVVAASSSVTSIQIANLLKLFSIPQVSYFSTSSELSSRERYPYFFRTIPSDAYQVEAMKDIIVKFNWSYVSVVYEESSYGKMALSSLEDLLRINNICIAVKAALPKDSDVARVEEYDAIVGLLLAKPKAVGVVIYGSDQEVQGMVRAIRRKNAVGKFTFIGSDGWSARELVYQDGYEEEILGTVSVQPSASPIRGFKEYFEKLTVESNTRNPWFYEMWEHIFKCRYISKPETLFNQNHSTICTGKENQQQDPYAYEQQLQFVSDATMVFAYALRDYFEDQCGDDEHCIRCHQDTYTPTRECTVGLEGVNGALLRDFIQNVSFIGLAGNHFSFSKDKADPEPYYNIIHFRRKSFLPSEFENGVLPMRTPQYVYEWDIVGTWHRVLELNFNELTFHTSQKQKNRVPISSCSEKCHPNEIRIIPSDGDKCCWSCQPCPQFQYKVTENRCKECPNGTIPTLNQTACLLIPEEVVSVLSIYGIICTCIAIAGTASTVFLLVIFIRHHHTPIVKASGRELSYAIIVGLFLCFAVTPLTLWPPSDAVCGCQRFLAGFCFTVVYAAILTKTNRIARIFKSGRRTIRRPHFISPKSQLVICACIASVQLVLVGVWLYAYPPERINIYPSRKDNVVVCKETVTNRYFLAYAYPILLCVVCTLYAYKTRKMPEAFNESHYIGAAVYTTCVVWLAFVPVYIVSKESTSIRVTSVCISTSLTAFVCQLCLFWPKVYVILFKPDRNIRQAISGSKPGTGGAVSRALLPLSSTAAVATTSTFHYRSERSDSSCCSDEEFLHLSAYRRYESKSSVATQTFPFDDSTLTMTDVLNTWPSTEFSDVDWIDQDDEPRMLDNLLDSNDIMKPDDVAL